MLMYLHLGFWGFGVLGFWGFGENPGVHGAGHDGRAVVPDVDALGAAFADGNERVSE